MDFELQTIESCKDASILTTNAKIITFPLSNEIKILIHALKERVQQLGGVGLAAPQINQLWQIMVVHITEEAKSMRANAFETMEPTIFINPTYEPIDLTMQEDWEACFSVENTIGKVPRFNKIHYKAQNEQGEWFEGISEGFTARVLQHEIDHLKGILIVNRLTKDNIYGSPKDMAALRILDMTPVQKQLMQKMIEEAIARGNSEERYKHMLELLKTPANERA